MTDKKEKLKIYVFCNSCNHEWHQITSLTEDGVFLARHVCSNHRYILNDMGFTSNWKHETYNTYAPNGWELILTESGSPELAAAYKRHTEYTEEEYRNKLSCFNKGEK